MKKIILLFLFIFLLFTFLPSVIFSQVNLGFTGGIGLPIASKEFKENFSPIVNAGFHREGVVGNAVTLGWELNLAHCFPTKQENDPAQLFSGLFYSKLQDNKAMRDDLQFFLKGGAGLGVAADGRAGGHPSFPMFALTFLGGAGANYMLKGGDKIFAETSFKSFYTGTKSNYYHGIYLNVGYSFCLNPSKK